MAAQLVILTGASGSGKTALASAVQSQNLPQCVVLFFDSIGVPSAEAMRAYGEGYQPGGAWQRATTIQWMSRIASMLKTGISILFEGQMRIEFIHTALALFRIENARILLVDCDDAIRTARLQVDRNQPELANADMLAWSRYLRDEATQAGCEILDTGAVPLEDCRKRIQQLLTGS
jgi:dephospho-CoA kinase